METGGWLWFALRKGLDLADPRAEEYVYDTVKATGKCYRASDNSGFWLWFTPVFISSGAALTLNLKGGKKRGR